MITTLTKNQLIKSLVNELFQTFLVLYLGE